MADPIEGQSQDAQTQGAAAGKTFTQADLDRVVQERLAREREKYADYDDAKKAKAELESIKAAQMSEAEKVAAAIKDRDTRLAELETKASQAEARATELIRQSKAVAIASNMGAYDATDANFAAAVAGIDPASTTADADIKAAIESLKSAKPYLFKPAGAKPLEPFNPGSGAAAAETSGQRAARVMRQSQGLDRGFGPF